MKNILFAMLFITAKVYAQTPCVEDRAVCNTTFDDLRHAVVKISMPGFGTFTGFLVNHTSNDGRLLVITTRIPFSTSCFAEPGDVTAALATTTFTFNDDFVSCSTTGATAVTTTGATLVSISDPLALLELNTAPALPELTYLGWDLTTTPTDVACIFQSTNTSVRKGIVTAIDDNMSAVGLSLECNESFTEEFGARLMTKVSEWDENEPTIEGRGAPLILQNLKVMGVYIIGDEDDCDKGPSYFFDLQFASAPFFSNLRSGSQTNSATIKRIPCQDNLPLSGPFGTSNPFSANNTITSTQVIADGFSVQYTAGTSVTLNSGFVSGTDFVAQIGSCTPQVITIAAKTDDIYNDNDRFQITESTNPDIKLFPNLIAANSPVFIESNLAVENVFLYITDINGKAIMAKQLNELQPNLPLKIDFPVVSSGLYFVQIATGDYLYTSKLMVQ